MDNKIKAMEKFLMVECNCGIEEIQAAWNEENEFINKLPLDEQVIYIVTNPDTYEKWLKITTEANGYKEV